MVLTRKFQYFKSDAQVKSHTLNNFILFKLSPRTQPNIKMSNEKYTKYKKKTK